MSYAVEREDRGKLRDSFEKKGERICLKTVSGSWGVSTTFEKETQSACLQNESITAGPLAQLPY
jgi:hypothetical protein